MSGSRHHANRFTSVTFFLRNDARIGNVLLVVLVLVIEIPIENEDEKEDENELTVTL